jgi:signal transduction histidine kinase
MAVKKLKLISKPLEVPEWLSHLDSPVLVYQKTTNEIWANPEFERTFGKVDLQGFLKPQTLHLFHLKPITAAVLSQPARYEECFIENKKGQRYFVNLKVSALSGEHESRTLVLIDDVTEKTRSQQESVQNHLNATEDRNEQIRILQKEKLEQIGRYAGGIMHNLSQPLQCIRGNSEELAATEPLSEQGKDFLNEIQKATTYLSDIVRSFKSYVRTGDDESTAISVSESLKQAVFFTKNTLLHQNIDLDVNEPSLSLPNIQGKQAQLVQVFVNLITNARDAIEEAHRPRGRIVITLSEFEGGVRAVIQDNGIGMDEVTSRRIFDPFFTTKTQGKGTGLGLSTSYGYLREMNAEISVKSEPGEGSAFTLTFPIPISKGETA